MSVAANALSSIVDRIVAVAISNGTNHTSGLFSFSVISHIKRVLFTHFETDKGAKGKYMVNHWIRDTSIQGTKYCVPLCPLKRGSTVV